MNNIDNVIENVMQKPIFEPIEFEQAIMTAFEKKRKNKIYSDVITKIITAIITIITITTNIVFAKDIYDWIYNIFNSKTTSRGIIKMSEEGYLQNVDMEYVGNDVSSLKIENIVMDDYNLDIVFKVKTKEKIEATTGIFIPDLIISDENKNLIFCDYNNLKEYEKYCKENDIEYSNMNMHNNITNCGYNIEIIEQTEDSIRFLYKMYSTKYPRSKKLQIRFETISINKTNNNTSKTLKGNWNIEIDLLEKFYNREVKTYIVKDNSDKGNNAILKKAEATNTEMQIDLKIKGVLERVEENEEGADKRLEDMFKKFNGYEVIDDATIENENGESIKTIVSSKEDNFSKVYNSNGDIDVHMCFGITKNEQTDKLKLKIRVKGKLITINLSK